jgi:drug/metabolite transporter (DMT)-like permease
MIRFVIGLLVVLAQAAARRRPLRVVRGDLLLMRGAFGGVAVLCYFLSIARLPVGTATLLNYTAPIFTSLFAARFLGERLRGLGLAAMAVAGTGVVLVVIGEGAALGGAYIWQAIAVGSAVLSGAAVTSIRAARRTDGAWEVFGAFCAIGILCTAPFAVPEWKSPAGTEWALLLAVGLLAALAQVLMTHALLVVDATTAGIIAQLTVVIALLLGHFFDGDPFTSVSVLGASLTVLGVSVATGWAEHRT